VLQSILRDPEIVDRVKALAQTSWSYYGRGAGVAKSLSGLPRGSPSLGLGFINRECRARWRSSEAARRHAPAERGHP
jgi:hypothetical protein